MCRNCIQQYLSSGAGFDGISCHPGSATFQSCHCNTHAVTHFEGNIVPSAGHKPEPENYWSAAVTSELWRQLTYRLFFFVLF